MDLKNRYEVSEGHIISLTILIQFERSRIDYYISNTLKLNAQISHH
jgi:hypothetical protein